MAHLKCNNRIRLCCCHISMPSAVPVVVLVVVVVACYFGIYRVLTQSQFQPTLFAFGHCQCRLSAMSIVVYRCGDSKGRGGLAGNPFPFPFSRVGKSIAVCLMKNAFVCCYIMWNRQIASLRIAVLMQRFHIFKGGFRI